MSQNELFSIRQMIELTGLSEFTIRGWENRYNAFSPHRSDTGRREYTKKDIERALLIRELLKRGHKISKIASFSHQKLQSLFEAAGSEKNISDTADRSRQIDQAVELMSLQKWTDLSILFKKISAKNASETIHNFFLPLIKVLAMQVQSNLVSIAQEHVLSSFIKEKIYSILSEVDKKDLSSQSAKKIRFVLATPEGDYHEIGLLLAHLMVRAQDFVSLYLGPNSPSHDLAETALRFEASHLLVVSTVSKKDGANQHLLNYVSDVQKKIGRDLKIIIAGNQAPKIPKDPKFNLQNVESFSEFETYLKSLR